MLSRRVRRKLVRKRKRWSCLNGLCYYVTFKTRNVLLIVIYIYNRIYKKRVLLIFLRKIENDYDNSSTTCRATLSHELVIYIYKPIYSFHLETKSQNWYSVQLTWPISWNHSHEVRIESKEGEGRIILVKEYNTTSLLF